jgi:hypothetical protein
MNKATPPQDELPLWPQPWQGEWLRQELAREAERLHLGAAAHDALTLRYRVIARALSAPAAAPAPAALATELARVVEAQSAAQASKLDRALPGIALLLYVLAALLVWGREPVLPAPSSGAAWLVLLAVAMAAAAAPLQRWWPRRMRRELA